MSKMNDMKNIKNIESILIIALIIMVSSILLQGMKVVGIGRVINYTGIIRGETQRYIKLEVCDIQSDNIENRLDKILYGLKNGDKRLELVKINDYRYQNNLGSLSDYWQNIKKEVHEYRNIKDLEKKRIYKSKILMMSEIYFNMANMTVSSSELYLKKLRGYMIYMAGIIMSIMVMLIIILFKEYSEQVAIIKNSKEDKKKIYIDMHTLLPNKNKCEEIFADMQEVREHTAVIMFDLNGLKIVNDTLGHMSGDKLIKDFAYILKNVIRETDFVGRYGGDEFVAILYNTGEKGVRRTLENIKKEAEEYNKNSKNMKINYAVGYECSEYYSYTNLKILLEKADFRMYENKRNTEKKNNIENYTKMAVNAF